MGLSSKLASPDVDALLCSQDLLEIPKPTSQARNYSHQQQQRPPPPPHWPPLKCPRCDSTNTKFCYYNNYSRTQPRHLCKACRRHWTQGGTLRNVPVGGSRVGKNNNKRVPKPTPTPPAAAASSSSAPIPFLFPDIPRQALLQSPPPATLQLAASDYTANLAPQITTEFDLVMNSCGCSNCYYGGWQAGQVSAMATGTSGGMDHSGADYWSGWDDEVDGCP
ncbi:dof zinc finger protein DOF1.4-like [Zingiber officinale]|uniref:Dof zinc finger protein n=1 Tax=Zingiber officinale TaxID=94328 RepID=A0A8J5HBH1_ZINOF|nr:dof zinc finger protein DOF1.4-like [Zingiber officinale]KAG6524421.1 hypothetical protein ZIOFF_014330 [Zingiber officinale]